jgi:glycosyltransferase involved in cell wall biosynthesis
MSRVTVVVPAYNNADYIAETMRSILEQDYPDFSVVVADHSSSDGTLRELAAFADDPRVTLLSTPAGGGAARNWQRVTDEAHSEFVKLVCGDDLLYPGALSAQVAAFDEHPEAVLVASRRDILDARGVPFVRARGLAGLVGLVDGRRAVRASVRAGTNLLGEPACVTMRTSALAEAGGWDPSAAYLIDQASYARVLMRGPMVGLGQAHAGFRVNSGQWSVALAQDQARQAAEFHEEMVEQGVVSAADARTGNVRAWVAALLRRTVYVVFARRLKAAT